MTPIPQDDLKRYYRQVVFLISIMKLRDQFAFSTSSWIRSPKHNKQVGGHKYSKHKDALAVDVILDDPMNDTKPFIRAVELLGYNYKNEGDHIHVQGAPIGPLNPEFKFYV